ncbi:hypothetical protein [Xenorhabdus bovienii]|uniref:hypothetical protein n=1 Tax=Xenorhabdus bovienii TaxID=40576 RepID=UPI0023B2EA34|nr:hypothetical protein [Xenorhabdus bovienii]MDE9464659.1 hypothetical protein [Xenorhabdus bovienii]
MEFLKLITPFITFLFGVLFIPIVENIKEKYKKKSIIKEIYIELDDEKIILENSIYSIRQSINERKDKPNNYPYLQLPKPLSLMILSKNLIKIYSELPNDTRQDCKNLLLIEESIKQNHSLITENYKKDNDKCLAIEKSMLYAMLGAYYLIDEMGKAKEKYVRRNLTNDEVVNNAAKSLGFEFSW